MTAPKRPNRDAIPSRRREFTDGLLVVVPILAVAAPIGVLFGALAVQQGLTPLEAVLMSLVVFAGSAQFVGIELWAQPLPCLTIAFTALVINLRHVMMSASVVRGMDQFRGAVRPASLFFLTDEVWALSERRLRQGPLTPAYYAGMASSMYANWVGWTAVGASVGALITDPSAYGLDFAFNALFIGLIMGFWRGISTTGLVILVSGAVAIATKAWLGGTWYIVLGGLAGMVVAAGHVMLFGVEPDEDGAAITSEARS